MIRSNTLLTLVALAALSACGERAAEPPRAPAAPSVSAPATPDTPAAPAVTAPPAASAPVASVPVSAVAQSATRPPPHPKIAPPTPQQAAQRAADIHAAVPMASPPDAAHQGLVNFRGVVARIPATWMPQRPANSMRLAQYTVPGSGGAAPGEAIVFFFPPGAGGSPTDNIGRWASQFTTPDGKPVTASVKQMAISKFAVTLVELNGTYSRGVSMGQGDDSKPDQTLLAAIVMTPDQRNVTFHLYGPKATIAGQRKAFDTMIKALHPPPGQ